jgi:hypothetical protein
MTLPAFSQLPDTSAPTHMGTLNDIQKIPQRTDADSVAAALASLWQLKFAIVERVSFVAFTTALGLPKSRTEFFGAIRRIPVAVGYALALMFSNIVMSLLSAGAQSSVANATSTNIAHLATDPFFVLPSSAFIDTDTGWLWMPLSLILIGGLERRFGSRRTFLIVFGAHVVATLISESVLLMQVVYHVMPHSQINIIDVGPSYVILAAMAGCLAVGSRSLRIVAFITGALIVPQLLVDLPELDMSSVGHFCALVFGAGFTLGATRFAGWARSTRREAVHLASTASSLAADAAAPVILLIKPASRVSS